MLNKSLWVSVFAVMLSGCSAKQPVAGATQGTRSTSQRNRDLITQDDVSGDLRAESVLELIRTLRPHFLNDRGTTALSDPEAGRVHASIDEGRIVPIGELNGMHGNEVIEIRYLNSSQALQKFGTAARQGPVILVTTMKR